MDGGAWQAAVHGCQSRTRLSGFTADEAQRSRRLTKAASRGLELQPCPCCLAVWVCSN